MNFILYMIHILYYFHHNMELMLGNHENMDHLYVLFDIGLCSL